MQTAKQSTKKSSLIQSKIAHNKPCLDDHDALAAYDAVKSGWVAYGDIGARLESKLTQSVFQHELQQNDGEEKEGVAFPNSAVLCSNGTAGIYLALHTLGIKSGDEIILPTYVCTALLNAILMINATPILVDIDRDNLSITSENIKKHITTRTKAIIAVHSYGIPCELDEIIRFGLPVIEDCAQALGSCFSDGQPIGSKGAMSVFSFYATKLLTGGYGGAVVAKSRKHLDHLRDYINFDNPEQFQPRFNFMLSDINSAVSLAQFDKLDKFLIRRKEIAGRYNDAIGQAHFQNQFTQSGRCNNFRYLINLPDEPKLIDLQNHLATDGIDSIIPLESRELLHNYLRIDAALFPNAEKAARTILSLPTYPCLTDAEVDRIVASLENWSFA